MMNNMKSILFLCLVLLSFLDAKEEKDYIEEATSQSLGHTVKSLEGSRTNDLVFTFLDPLCVCSTIMMNHFKDEVDEQVTDRLYTATDNLIAQFSLVLEEIDLEIGKISNLKQMNELYSFSQLYELTGESISGFPRTYAVSPEGCPLIDVNNEADWNVFLSVISTHESGGSYTAKNPDTYAYGRYQFIPSTGKEYCYKAKNKGASECGSCVPAYGPNGSIKVPQTWWGSTSCQDKMYEAFTKNNQKILQNNGIPVTTCSLYVAHQQGAEGANQIYRNNISTKVKRNMLSNMGRGVLGINEAAAYTVAYTREKYVEFWNKRFGANILEVSGDINSTEENNETQKPEEKTTQEQRNNFFREGILLELYKQRDGFKGWFDELVVEP